MKVKCSVCNSDEKVILEDKPLSLYRCGACRHVFKDLPEKFEETYDEDYYLDEHKNWFANPDYPLFDFIEKEISKIKKPGPTKVLDVGCGKGDFLKYLKDKNPALELYGIDLTSNDSSAARPWNSCFLWPRQ
ncbi:methyltransferase domain-containing protein [Candidatus Omnitrophota bacterium]